MISQNTHIEWYRHMLKILFLTCNDTSATGKHEDLKIAEGISKF